MTQPRIVICGVLEHAQEECKALFDDVAEVIIMDSPDRKTFLADLRAGHKYAGVHGLIRHWKSVDTIGLLDNELIEALPTTVKYIASLGAGYDMVDIEVCQRKGILVSNTPGVGDNATATAAFYLIISSLRRFSQGERDLHAGLWRSRFPATEAYDLTGRTLAILGLGGIGLRLAQLVQAFPMRVVYHNRRRVEHAPAYCEYYDVEHLDDMLAAADVFSIHVPLREETKGLVNEKMIRKLKRGAILINTARGGIIDENAMISALEDGHLSAIGLDVFPDEPHVHPRLLQFPNATLLPHLGGVSADAQKVMETRALTNLRDFLVRGTARDTVPELR